MPLIRLGLSDAPTGKAAPVPETRSNPLENPAIPLSTGAGWLFDAFGADPTAAGVSINETTAMQLAAVFSCVNVIASDVASLPLKTYEHLETGKRPAEGTDLYYLLAVEPNPEMTSVSFISTVTACAVLTGNGYAEIQRDAQGRPVALYPRHPSSTRPVRMPNGDLAFEITDTGTRRIVANTDMLHVPGLSLDGYGGGISPIQAAKQTLGLHKAAELSSAHLFGNGSRPSGILTLPTGIDDQQRINARESWERSQSGENQGRTAVLPVGFSWQSISVSPEDMQFIATMQYTRSGIAGLFRIPPHMIGDTSRLSNSNHESQALEYVTFTLRPWLTRWETEVQRKLMPSVGRNAGRYSVRFDISELIRGDFATQMAGFATARQWGFASANDVRTALGQNPIGPKGDIYMVPLNMVDAAAMPDMANDQQDVTPADQNPPIDPVQQPSEEELSRTLISRMTQTYSALFRDALGRVTAREKRDSDSISRCFTPILQTIADEASRQATVTFLLSPEQAAPTDKIIRDALKMLEKRASDWTPSAIDTNVATDLSRIARAIVLGVYREAAASMLLSTARD